MVTTTTTTTTFHGSCVRRTVVAEGLEQAQKDEGDGLQQYLVVPRPLDAVADGVETGGDNKLATQVKHVNVLTHVRSH